MRVKKRLHASVKNLAHGACKILGEGVGARGGMARARRKNDLSCAGTPRANAAARAKRCDLSHDCGWHHRCICVRSPTEATMRTVSASALLALLIALPARAQEPPPPVTGEDPYYPMPAPAYGDPRQPVPDGQLYGQPGAP